MRVSKSIILTCVLFLALLCGSSLLYAQEKMTMEVYQEQLAEWQQREATAKKATEECGTKCESLKGETESVQAEIDQVWSEILEEIGTDQAGVDAFRADLEALDAQCDGLLALTPEELFKKREEVEAIEANVAEAKENPISALTEMQNLIATIDGKLTQIKNKMPKAVYDEYTVVVGDYLWKISGKPDIYNDPTHWMRIYSYNKELIEDPDLIHPDWILKIQREVGPDEYLVAMGDYLQKIAENPDVLGDPANWTEIYEKNKSIIGDDPNMIFPHTVLVIPKE